jgi:hypothetical protein
MGSYLHERLGEKYAPVGLFAHRVDINWNGAGVQEFPPRDGDDDLEKQLNELGIPALVLDLADNAVLTPGREYALSDSTRGVPSRHYRAIVFLEHSPPYAEP